MFSPGDRVFLKRPDVDLWKGNADVQAAFDSVCTILSDAGGGNYCLEELPGYRVSGVLLTPASDASEALGDEFASSIASLCL